MNTELTISLPQSMKDFIDGEVAAGNYSTPDEYVRDLIEEAKSRRAEERLGKLLLEAVNGSSAQPLTQEDWDEIKQRGSARLSQPPLYETATPAELAQAFWEWAESHDRNIPPLPLAAVSRASIYEDR